MAKSKKKEKETKKPSVKIEDLRPASNPSGGSKVMLEYQPIDAPRPAPMPITTKIST